MPPIPPLKGTIETTLLLSDVGCHRWKMYEAQSVYGVGHAGAFRKFSSHCIRFDYAAASDAAAFVLNTDFLSCQASTQLTATRKHKKKLDQFYQNHFAEQTLKVQLRHRRRLGTRSRSQMLRFDLFQLSRRQTTIMTYHQDLKRKKHTHPETNRSNSYFTPENQFFWKMIHFLLGPGRQFQSGFWLLLSGGSAPRFGKTAKNG